MSALPCDRFSLLPFPPVMTHPAFPSSPLRCRPASSRAVVVGGGTMGAAAAVMRLPGGCRTAGVEASASRCAIVPDRVRTGPPSFGREDRAAGLLVAASLGEGDWPAPDLVIEGIPEKSEPKQRLFADPVTHARPDALLTSNNSSFPVSAIAEGLPTPACHDRLRLADKLPTLDDSVQTARRTRP
jgi:3-hydroxyacyl-CoA dehydrogenase